MAERQYLIKLFQVARINTESFTVAAADEKAAKAQADAIAKDKGLTKDFDFEIEDLTALADAQATEEQPAAPGEPEAR